MKKKPRLLQGIILLNTLLPYFFALAYLGLWAYGIFLGDFTPKDYAKIFFLPALALLLVSTLRVAVDRPRPFSEEGAGITPLREKKRGRNSFPSRHVTCAAVIATIFLPFLSAVSATLFLFCIALGYARFALGWHYPSDLLVGGLLGVAVGVFVFFL